MPCDTISQTNVVIGPNTDATLLFAALQELKLNPQKQGSMIYFAGGTYRAADNTLTLNGSNVESRTAEMKRAYSGEVVKSQARRFGWTLKQGKEKYQYVVTKRSI